MNIESIADAEGLFDEWDIESDAGASDPVELTETCDHEGLVGLYELEEHCFGGKI